MTGLYQAILRPLLFTLEPEAAHRVLHHAGVTWGRYAVVRGVLRRLLAVDDARLQTRVAGMAFPNPVGLAAGFDKSGDLVGFLSSLGFGFLEVGSLTRLPWAGAPPPRIFRLPQDDALINRVGLSNPGVERSLELLASAPLAVPLGISVAKTPDPFITGEAALQDFIDGVMAVYDRADYLALNISCLNTADGQPFSDPALLDALLAGIRTRERRLSSAKTPLFVKLSPDMPSAEYEQMLATCMKHAIGGLIIGNTTQSRAGLVTPAARLGSIGPGSVSGRPLRERALQFVARAYRDTAGRLPIIGCGGIFTGEDAYRFIRAGAALVQLYTGVIYRGLGVVHTINRELLQLLKRDGFTQISQAVGTA